MDLNVQNCEFLGSAVKPDQYPAHDLKEIALVGRSNVGKSSLINAVVNRRKFARTSNQPGRTQTINFYRVDYLTLVDLPGYGFAKVPGSVREQWKSMIETYLLQRPNLVGLLQVVDIRHKPSVDDQVMCEWMKEMGVPFAVVATKADKISRGKYQQHLKVIKDTLGVHPVLFSADTKVGRDEIVTVIREFNTIAEG